MNRLAQRFYEVSGISLPAMTDKPKVVQGLRAVFEEVGIEVENSRRIAFNDIKMVRASNCQSLAEMRKRSRATIVFFSDTSWACSCGAGYDAKTGRTLDYETE